MRTLKEHRYHRSLDEFLRRCDQEEVMLEWIRNNFEKIIGLLPSSPAGETTRFIGVGCGNGIMDVEMLKLAKNHFSQMNNVGIDPNSEALAVFKDRIQRDPAMHTVNNELILGTAEKYHCGSGISLRKDPPKSHLIHMLHMLYHVKSIEGAIQKYYSMLLDGGVLLISLASRANNQLYNTFKKFETLQSNQTKPSSVERNDKRYSDDVIHVLDKLGYHYRLESVQYRLDISGCLEREMTEGGKLLLDFVCLTNAARSYETLSEENQRALIECLKECTSTEEGKNHVKLSFDIITVIKPATAGGAERQTNGIK